MKEPMTWNSRKALMRMAVSDHTGVDPGLWTPDGRSLRGLQARGLAHPFGIPTSGRELAAELLAVARLNPEIREDWMRDIRKMFGADDELIDLPSEGS